MPAAIPTAGAMPPALALLVDKFAFMLMKQYEVRMLATFVHTFKALSTICSAYGIEADSAFAFVSALLQATGGGIIIPLLLNKNLAPLTNDMLVLTLLANFAIQHFAPQVREVASNSLLLNAVFEASFHMYRSNGICGAVRAANANLPASIAAVGFPIFGPIFLGTIGGCAGGFLPFSKGLTPIQNGIKPPMLTAFLSAVFYHTWCTVYGGDEDGGQVLVATFLIAVHVALLVKAEYEKRKRSDKSAAKTETGAETGVVKQEKVAEKVAEKKKKKKMAGVLSGEEEKKEEEGDEVVLPVGEENTENTENKENKKEK
jgi:hypothetical protein